MTVLKRLALTDEMHVRRFPPFSAPARIFQIVVITTDEPAKIETNPRQSASSNG
jgi:hypothetical protein